MPRLLRQHRQQRGHDARPAGAQWVAQGYSAAVDVHAPRVGAGGWLGGWVVEVG